MMAIWHWCFGEDGTGRALFFDMFLQFLPCKAWRPWQFNSFWIFVHVRIFQIHTWHCGMWWRWNVSGQEDSDGAVALFHNSKQEPWCNYWWRRGKRDHVLTHMLEYFSAKYLIWWIWTSAIGNIIWFQIRESPTSSRMVTWSSLHL